MDNKKIYELSSFDRCVIEESRSAIESLVERRLDYFDKYFNERLSVAIQDIDMTEFIDKLFDLMNVTLKQEILSAINEADKWEDKQSVAIATRILNCLIRKINIKNIHDLKSVLAFTLKEGSCKDMDELKKKMRKEYAEAITEYAEELQQGE